VKGERYFFILHLRSLFSLSLFQLPQDAANTGGLAVLHPCTPLADVAVGAGAVALESADGQLLPAAAADEAAPKFEALVSAVVKGIYRK